jgi:hypothetical protein
VAPDLVLVLVWQVTQAPRAALRPVPWTSGAVATPWRQQSGWRIVSASSLRWSLSEESDGAIGRFDSDRKEAPPEITALGVVMPRALLAVGFGITAGLDTWLIGVTVQLVGTTVSLGLQRARLQQGIGEAEKALSRRRGA